MEFKIEYEIDENGKQEAKDFLDELEKINPDLVIQLKVKINRARNRSNHGKALTEHIDDDLYAIRARYDRDIARIFWTFGEKRDIWLLGGIRKQYDRLRKDDLKYAKKLLKAFKERRKYVKR